MPAVLAKITLIVELCPYLPSAGFARIDEKFLVSSGPEGLIRQMPQHVELQLWKNVFLSSRTFLVCKAGF